MLETFKTDMGWFARHYSGNVVKTTVIPRPSEGLAKADIVFPLLADQQPDPEPRTWRDLLTFWRT